MRSVAYIFLAIKYKELYNFQVFAASCYMLELQSCMPKPSCLSTQKLCDGQMIYYSQPSSYGYIYYISYLMIHVDYMIFMCQIW